jgi:hypothetical protein
VPGWCGRQFLSPVPARWCHNAKYPLGRFRGRVVGDVGGVRALLKGAQVSEFPRRATKPYDHFRILVVNRCRLLLLSRFRFHLRTGCHKVSTERRSAIRRERHVGPVHCTLSTVHGVHCPVSTVQCTLQCPAHTVFCSTVSGGHSATAVPSSPPCPTGCGGRVGVGLI